MRPQVDLDVRWDSSRGAWVVKHRGTPPGPGWHLRVFYERHTKRQALKDAATLGKQLAQGQDSGTCEVYVYRRFGQRSRWVDRRTYGRDPRGRG